MLFSHTGSSPGDVTYPTSCVKEQLRPNLDRLGLPRCWIHNHRFMLTTRGEQHTTSPVRYWWHGMVGCGAYPPWAKTVYTHTCIVGVSCVSVTLSLARSLAQSHSRSVTHSLTHSLTHSPSDRLTHSFCHSVIHSLIHSLTHPLTHSLAHPLTHSPTHSFIPHTND